MNQLEEWRPVVGYEGRYEVSNFGGVRAVARTVKFGRAFRFIEPKNIYQHMYSRGSTPYFQVGLWIGKVGKSFKVHRLVLEAFHGVKPAGMQARHLDGNSLRNHAENLCWGTASENIADRTLHGTWRLAMRQSRWKLTEDQVIEIRKSTLPAKHFAALFSVTRENIYAIRKGVTWTSN